MIEDELKNILHESYDIDEDKIKNTDRIKDFLDSIDYLSFLMEVKKKYRINIETNDLSNLQTIEQIALVIQNQKTIK